MKENASKREEERTTRDGAANGRTTSIPLFGSIIGEREQVRDVIKHFLARHLKGKEKRDSREEEEDETEGRDEKRREERRRRNQRGN